MNPHGVLFIRELNVPERGLFLKGILRSGVEEVYEEIAE